MNCYEIREQIYSYMDGELTLWRSRAVSIHLSECPPCSSGMEFKVVLRASVAQRSAEVLPPELQDRILALIAAERSGPE